MSSTALRLALAFLALAILAPLLSFLGWLPGLIGFGLFAVSLLVGGLVSVIAGLISWRRAKGRGQDGRPGLIAAAIGLLLLGVGALAASGSRGVPAIHDITTSPDRPPAFEALADVPANENRDLGYPHGSAETPVLQRHAYPDLAPVELSVPPEQAFARSLEAARELGWEVVAQDPDRLRIEATDTTRIFRFVDDVAIEVEPSGGGSVVHVRSTSRVGRSDLGANAERIRDFARSLQSGG